jgi:hypothetical protein
LTTARAVKAEEPTFVCPSLEDPFAVLNGRSFYHRACAPRWTLSLRGTTASYPKAPPGDRGGSISSIATVLGDGQLATATPPQVQDAISRAGLDDDPVAATFLFHYLLSTNRDQLIATDGRKLSMPQIVAVTRYLGYLAGLRYDWAKKESITRPIVSAEEVTDAAAAELTETHRERLAGDCADVANAQGKLLTKLGARDAVVATSSFIPGLHTTAVARQPGRQTYYEFNFGLVARSSAREGSELLQVPGVEDMWVDVGPGIYLNQPGGRTVAYVPTNAGKLFAEAAGMDFHELEPLARADSSLLGAQLSLPGGTSLQTFTAHDSTGSYYAGLAVTQAWASRSYFPGVVALVAGGRRTGQGLSVADLYLQLDQRATTPAFHLGRWTRLRIDAAAILVVNYAIPFHDLENNTLGVDAALFINAGTELTVGNARSRLSGRVRAELQVMPGLTNVGGSTPTAFINHGLVLAEGRVRVTRRGMYLVASGAVAIDYFGERLAGGAGVDTPRLSIRFEGIGRAIEDSPTYKEGSLRRGRFLAGYSIFRSLRLSGLVEVQEAAADPAWTVTGALSGRF